MTDQEFEIFLREAKDELKTKQDVLMAEYGLGTFSRWWFDQETEVLQFINDDGNVGLEANFIDIGSYSPKTGTWKWAWANDSVLPKLRAKGEVLKELEFITGFEIFSKEEPFEVDEPMSWELAAIAVRQLGAIGCYRAPASDGLHMFLAIMSITPTYH